ncbi:DUF3304 domain-containing protein [Klebsiella pneumoniae]|uniref:DUF3304 domain-containing protein n=1 Tax=Klebsiella pneumoniae TaxID=573 RepID=UPI00209DFA03|nr:DUF3304 domain-containing protein [Klebsiella pneumoniae]MCP1062113.1 DUF3304 domain-containing protein [Klebsiella pneumoniae]
MKSALISPLLAGLLLLTGCAQPAAQAGGGGGGTIKAINHTKWAINHFSVNGQSGVCGITVHFLPCDDVKVTTSCWSPRNANYPIKEPVRMKEPAVCPK